MKNLTKLTALTLTAALALTACGTVFLCERLLALIG